MIFTEEFKHKLFEINEKNFNDSSLAAFEYQYHACEIYQDYCNYLQKTPKSVKSLLEIPFIPIEFFKNHAIKSGNWKESKVFKSSGTTETGRSKHFIKDLDHYHQSAKRAFEIQLGPLNNYKIIAILPSYQSQGDSSLISMVDYFMQFCLPGSGYFINGDLSEISHDSTNKLIIGVSYALLDLADSDYNIQNAMVMETGGMKGRRKEITRQELHGALKKGFDINEVWSEYGMTELQSQAYGKNGIFKFGPWAKCIIRDIDDPFTYLSNHKTGGINIIDLANIDSCCFIETKDLGVADKDTFEVLGRFDNSDIRGCNLMI